MTIKNINRVGFLFIFCLAIGSCDPFSDSSSEVYLSNLEADESSPIYTTYAAAMERSEFILDEGYQFMFYEDEKPVSFFTDAGPEISFIFKMGEQEAHYLNEMYKKPVLKLSYPDMVIYEYQPFRDVFVDVNFVVHSSRAAFWDIEITNNTNQQQAISVIPYIHNVDQAFGDPQIVGEDQTFYFTHSQYPDSWTRSHNLPHVTKRWNAFRLSESPDSMGIFNSFSGENFIPPAEVISDKESVFQLSGRAHTTDGARIIQKPPQSRIQLYLENYRSRIITQNSPVWGGRQSIIDNQGYFQMELGVLGDLAEGEPYTFTFYDEPSGDVARYTNRLPNINEISGERHDVTLRNDSLPPVPQNVTLSKRNGNISIQWEGNSDLSYRIYRRNYQQVYYELIEEGITTNQFVDDQTEPELTYGYVVVAENNQGQIGMHSREVTNIPIYNFQRFTDSDQGSTETSQMDQAKVMAFRKEFTLDSGAGHQLQLSRYVSDQNERNTMLSEIKNLETQPVDSYQKENESLFSNVPEPDFQDKDREMLYWSVFNMMRQVFYPPEGESSYNYYVFSREPVWGWGHGGQVFHESITMMAYALLDPQSAMNSQRVYKERQYDSGYINYRTGSYLNEIIEYNDQLTSSAPWYSWINYEVYKMTGEKEFLAEMYESSKAFYEFYTSNRDSDADGLAEWGGHAVLESVRDALVAVWDEVDWPSNFEGVDVNSMLVKEAKSLEAMALELGLEEEAERWRKDYEQRSKLINETFWDDENGFYYHVDKTNHSFSYNSKNDLKRAEIIGFLPLWAGVATEEQAERLVEKLTDPDQFWRKYGVPSLSASDPYYNDKGYWNGPVWVEWNYLIMQGLLDYGYEEEAKELVDRVAKSMIIQLKDNHTLWEFYSPDDEWGGYHQTYIWAGIINRMLLDTRDIRGNN